MSGWDDLPDEMRGERIDADTMDRLLRGRMGPDDAPPGYSDVASVLLAVASQPSQEEFALEMQHVAAARAVVGPRAVGRRIRPRRLVAALAVMGALVAIPGLAAGNVLPDPAQHAVSHVLDKVGVSVPAGISAPANETHPANAGVHPASTGAEISSLARTTDATGVAKGAAISSLASGGKSQAGQHGKAATAGSNGKGAANSASRGHSAARPANAASHASNAGGAPTHP